MAILTEPSFSEFCEFLGKYGLGSVVGVVGIPAGSVNSNFRVELDSGRYFLRIYEEQDSVGALSEAAMLSLLASRGVPTPAPIATSYGPIGTLRGKPAALFPWREGGMRCQTSVSKEDVRRLGEALAKVHQAGSGTYRGRGRFRYEDLLLRLERIRRDGSAEFQALAGPLEMELKAIHASRDPSLPQGLIHGDLFRDNVLWHPSGELSALLDFESAFDGTYAFDLMVTLLAWCTGDTVDQALARALIAGYQTIRPLTDVERRGLFAEAKMATIRFTLTRITDYAMRSGEGIIKKDWRRWKMRGEFIDSLGAAGLDHFLFA